MQYKIIEEQTNLGPRYYVSYKRRWRWRYFMDVDADSEWIRSFKTLEEAREAIFKNCTSRKLAKIPDRVVEEINDEPNYS